MLNYIIRRLFLMIFTLVGITFMVFTILAMAPGGIGAGLTVSAGGTSQAQSGVAVTRAKMEDRYGLNAPWIVQYGRWLARISPVRFGQPDLRVPDSGETIAAPRPVPEPAVWEWFPEMVKDSGGKLPEPDKTIREATAAEVKALGEDQRTDAFRIIQREYASARGEFTVQDANLREALKRYIDEKDLPNLLDSNFKPRLAALVALGPPDKTARAWPDIQKFGETSITSYAKGQSARERFVGAMAASPYPNDGIVLIPGTLSLAWPDLGTAFSTGKPVRQLIAKHLPVTLLMNAIAIPIIYLVAIPSGILAAVRKGSMWDVGLGAFYIALYSVPTVLAGVLALGYLATPKYLDLFPTAALHDKNADAMPMLPMMVEGAWNRGYILDTGWHLVLPVLCSVYAGFAFLSKLTRGTMLDNFNADYVRTAKAKGVAEKDVIFRHVFRNSLLPLITVFVAIFPGMLAGSVVIERIFSIPGMGFLTIESIYLRDREQILATTFIVALVNLLALLLADILYAVADPRITFK